MLLLLLLRVFLLSRVLQPVPEVLPVPVFLLSPVLPKVLQVPWVLPVRVLPVFRVFPALWFRRHRRRPGCRWVRRLLLL